MKVQEAQGDMRDAYMCGGSGVLISGIIWVIAGVTAIYATNQISFMVFFFGGMLIHPLSVLLDKLFNRRGKHSKENPLANLALESTVLLFIGLYLVYLLFELEPNWLFPIMLFFIGARYLIFQSIYGLKIYWILGLILIGMGFFGLNSNQPFYTFGIIGGVVELIFSILIIRRAKDSMDN